MFLYELAHNLGLPLYQLEHEMPYEELVGWAEYFRRRPYGWKDDQRTGLILQVMGSKVKTEEVFPSVATVYKEARESERYRVEQIKKNDFIARFMMPHLEENDNDS